MVRTATLALLPAVFLAGGNADAFAQSNDVAPWMRGITTFSGKQASPEPTTTPEPTATSESAASVDPLRAAGYQMPLVDNTKLNPPPIPTPPPTSNGQNRQAIDEVVNGIIGQAVASDSTAEPPPLAEQTMNWYQVPWRWMTEGWDNHAELGLDGSSGNARTLAFQTGLEMKRKTDRYTLGFDFDYRKATNRGATTEDNGRFNADYDRLFSDNSKWSAFAKFGAEWDQFKAFDSRINLNGGLGYHFIRTDDALFATKFGAGASKEIGAPDDDWKPEAVFGIEAEYQLNRYNKMKGKVDYFPAWEDFADYRLVTDLAWEILLDDTDNLSLKLAVTDRYDSTPQGARPNDVYYSLLLLVKF